LLPAFHPKIQGQIRLSFDDESTSAEIRYPSGCTATFELQLELLKGIGPTATWHIRGTFTVIFC
jgi:hypothetical protein